MNNERYKLIDLHYGYIVVDEWLARSRGYDTDEYEYEIMPEHYNRRESSRLGMEDLIAKLNEYNLQLNGEYDEAKVNRLLSFENQVYPQLNALISEKIQDSVLYSHDKIKLNYCDMDYNTGDFEQYQIECSIKHTDRTGYTQPNFEDELKDMDEYTRTKILVKINQYLDNCKNDSERLLLTGLRNEILIMD